LPVVRPTDRGLAMTGDGLVTCPACGQRTATDTGECSWCDRPLGQMPSPPTPSRSQRRGGCWGAALILLFGLPLVFVLGAGAGLSSFSCSGGYLGEGCSGGSWPAAAAVWVIGTALVIWGAASVSRPAKPSDRYANIPNRCPRRCEVCGARVGRRSTGCGRCGGREPARNDPCWCGSDRKYKKCHGGTVARLPRSRF